MWNIWSGSWFAPASTFTTREKNAPDKLRSFKEATLERAAFKAGWSELSWSGRPQSVLAYNGGDKSLQKMERNNITSIPLTFFPGYKH